MRSIARPIALPLIAALTCVAMVGCSSENIREYAGVVVDDTVTLQVPALTMPAVDLDAGFAPNPAGVPSLATARRSSVTTVTAVTSLGSMSRVASVAVEPGEMVRTGQEIARLEVAALDANVAVAKAAHATAKAQVGVLDDALSTVAENRSTLASKRREVNAAEAQLTTTRATLASQLAQAKALLAKIEAMGAGGRPGGGPGAPPGTAPTGTVPPGTTPPPGMRPPGALPDPAQLRATIAKLNAALAEIDAGLGKVASGRAQLSSARANLADARTRLTDIRTLARVAADAGAVGVQLAQYQRELSVIRTPVDGVIVSVVSAGEVLASGAALAEVRTSAAPRVTTWIAPQDLGDLRPGTRATVSGDWFRPGTGRTAGVVSHISPRAEYPPTSFSTSDIHMTRAIRVEIVLPPTADQPTLPPGAPVDVRFLGR